MAKETKSISQSDDTEIKKFSYEALRKKSRELFIVSQSTFDGATAHLDRSESYTIAEIKQTIEIWLKGACK